MANVKFYLDNRNDKDGKPIVTDLQIFLFYSFNGQRLKYYTGKKTDLRYFDPGAKKLIKDKAPNREDIIETLDILKTHVQKIHRDAIALSIPPTVSHFKTELDKIIKPKNEKVKKFTVQDAMSEYLEFVKKEKAYNTFRNNQTAINQFNEYWNKEISFNLIDQKIIDGFRDFLINKSLLNNSVAKNLRVIRTFLNWSKEKKYHTNSDFKIQVKENDIDVIFLNYDEIIHLYNLDLKSEALQRVRDVFIFGCFTGMRHGDIFKLKKTDIVLKENRIKFFIQKGGHTVSQTVPLVEITKDILKKYFDLPGEKALPVIANQKMNEALKIIAEKAGFNEIVTVAEKQGNGEIKEKQFYKYDLITCHTSRKSFITVAMMRGMSDNVIKSITGHKKDSKAFAKYYEIIDSVKDQEMNRVF